jgi:hypothetical protein
MLVTATKQWPFYFSRNTIYDSGGSVTKMTANRTKPVDAAGSPTLLPKEIVKTPDDVFPDSLPWPFVCGSADTLPWAARHLN